MGTFHEHTHELHGITVVVDTDGPEIYVGRCHDMDERRVILHDVDVHRDGRAMLVQPTVKARESMPKLIALANTLLDEAFAGLQKADIEALGAVAERIRDNLNR